MEMKYLLELCRKENQISMKQTVTGRIAPSNTKHKKNLLRSVQLLNLIGPEK